LGRLKTSHNKIQKAGHLAEDQPAPPAGRRLGLSTTNNRKWLIDLALQDLVERRNGSSTDRLDWRSE
jgi:hypothetical protein